LTDAGNQHSASVASTLLPEEVEALAAIALALPDGWIVAVLAPDGQLAIGPENEIPYHTRCWSASPATRRIRRRPWRPVA
jgi:hypothetical protein